MPDFYIVGAPRCATTYMHRVLAAHPDVFMPTRQRPHHCVDLDPGPYPGDDEWIRTEDAYVAQFEAAPTAALIGEACPWYLYSAQAAQRIRDRRPDARVIIGLRHPVDQMVARHALRTREGTEDLPFVEALAAEADRVAGRRLPMRVRQPARYMYSYRAGARFSEQVRRYLDRFPGTQVHFYLLEDLRRDERAVVRGVLGFLGLDVDFEPRLGAVDATGSYGPLGRALLSRRARDAARRLPEVVRRPARAAAERVLASSWNPNRRPSIPGHLRDTLDAEYAIEIEWLSELIGRDLRLAWARARA